MSSSTSRSLVQEEVANHLDDEDLWRKVCGGDDNSNNEATTTNSSIVIGKQLRNIESQLRCLICSNFLKAPVTTIPCSHTFCSECISTHIRRCHKSTGRTRQVAMCAECQTDLDTSGIGYKHCLLPNRCVEALVHEFTKLRTPLLLQQQAISKKEEKERDHHDDDQKENRYDGESGSDDNIDSSSSIYCGSSSNQSSQRRSQLRNSRNGKNSSRKAQKEATTPSDADPVAATLAMLQQQQQDPENASSSSVPLKLERKSKCSYKGKKLKELQRLCSAEGLLIFGT